MSIFIYEKDNKEIQVGLKYLMNKPEIDHIIFGGQIL
jgi:L-lysine 2,3-aminomutase